MAFYSCYVSRGEGFPTLEEFEALNDQQAIASCRTNFHRPGTEFHLWQGPRLVCLEPELLKGAASPGRAGQRARG